MQEARIADWLKSIQGIATALFSAGAAFCAIYVAIDGKLGPVAEFLGMKKDAARVAAQIGSCLLLLPLLWFVLHSYRRFAKASRLERPDQFTLSATTPETLIGRTEELARLLDSVGKNRVVLLDGESGCGKSALVAGGLVPRLLAGTGLLPVLVRDWGDDWVRGPMAAALGALFEVLTPEQRGAIGWTVAPDLAAGAAELAAELGRRFDSVAAQLGRRPLLITDQFDDYQGRHREHFVDADGNWLKPEALAAANPFWALTLRRLTAGALHLLAVTRSDTASGLYCVRFVDASMTAARRLPRVDLEYLRPLLERIAPADAAPLVVSNPDQGWLELRDRLEADLRLQGAILMQQVHTVLLGLRQLPILNVAAFRRAGELRGTESLVVARAIRRASEAVGGGVAKQTLAREILGALVLPGGANQPAKAQRATFAALVQLVGHNAMTTTMLLALQAEDVVRPAEGLGVDAAWQLDHDYLAHAVLAEARQANRWSLALSEGFERFSLAGGVWRKRWTALLPMRVQARLLWERIRGRLRYGEASGYALASSIRPVSFVAIIVLSASCLAYFRSSALDSRAAEDLLTSLSGTEYLTKNESTSLATLETRAPGAARSALTRIFKVPSTKAAGSTEVSVSQFKPMFFRVVHSAWGLRVTPQTSSDLLTGMISPECFSSCSLGQFLLLAELPSAIPMADSTSAAIGQAMVKRMGEEDTNAHVVAWLGQALASLERSGVKNEVVQQGGQALLKRMGEVGPDLRALYLLNEALVKLAGKGLNDDTIEQWGRVLVKRIGDNDTDYLSASEFGKKLAAISAKNAIVRQWGHALAKRMGEVGTKAEVVARLGETLGSLATAGVEDADIQQGAKSLVTRMCDANTDDFACASLGKALASLAAAGVKDEVVQQGGEAVAKRIGDKATDVRAFAPLSEAIAGLASKGLKERIVKQAVAGLVQRMGDETLAANDVAKLTQTVTALPGKGAEKELLRQEALVLVSRMSDERIDIDLATLCQVSHALAGLVEKGLSDKIVLQGQQALIKRTRDGVVVLLGSDPTDEELAGLADLAGKAEKNEFVQQWGQALIQRIGDANTDASTVEALSRVLATLASKGLKQYVIQQGEQALVKRMLNKKENASMVAGFGWGLAALAGNGHKEEFVQQGGQAIVGLIDDEETHNFQAVDLGFALAALSRKGISEELVQRGGRALVKRMRDKTTEQRDVSRLGEALATLASMGVSEEYVQYAGARQGTCRLNHAANG